MPKAVTHSRVTLYAEPVRVAPSDVFTGELTTLLASGLVNPFGPTLEAVVADGSRSGTAVPLGVTELGQFLFGEERASVDAYRPILFEVQGGVCLYCRQPLTGKTQVDHFVPWSRYPADLGHNFVLAHERCNNAKSDALAAEDHLRAWVERNRQHQDELEIGWPGQAAAQLNGDRADRAVGVLPDGVGQRTGVGAGRGSSTTRADLGRLLRIMSRHGVGEQ